MVAWLIRASWELFGGWSVRLSGDGMAAVRLPAVLCGTLTLGAIYLLTVRRYRDARVGLAAVLAALTLPVLAAGSLLMTIDSPFVCCWSWALILAHRLFFPTGHSMDADASEKGNRYGGWVALGIVVGLGILAKYTMVLFLASMALYLLSTPSMRSWLRRREPWLILMVAGACCVPILVWNVEHDWVTIRHVARQAGVHGNAGFRWWGPLEYVGGQAALLLGFWFYAWAAAMVGTGRRAFRRPREEATFSPPLNQQMFLWWFSVPTFAVFFAFSPFTKVQLNWPVTAYISGLVLAVGWLQERWRHPIPTRRLAFRTATGLALGIGLTITVITHHTEWLYPVYTRIAGPAAPGTTPIRRWDPTCRLRGWRTLVRHVNILRKQLRDQGVEPVLAASSWTIPGEIAFYLDDHPPVYSLAGAVGGRHSQYDLWRPNPLADPQFFRGRTFIYVGPMPDALKSAFTHVGKTTLVTHKVSGQPVATWAVSVCHGFRGSVPIQASGY